MYKDIIELIKSNNNIIIYDKTENNYSSMLIQLMLTNFSITNVTIIDTTNEINFIKQNFKTDSTINLLGYDSENNIMK